MRIPHPLLGLRDASEFVYLGDASLLLRPHVEAGTAAFYDYVYLRDNPSGSHQELWYHQHGDGAWLVVTRDTVTHAIIKVELARDVKQNLGRR